MKSISRIAALFLTAAACNLAAKADNLWATNPIMITGSVYSSASSSPDGKAKPKPITITNILKALGITGQNASNLKYYYDGTTNAVVVAEKGISDGGTGTPIATVFAYGSNIGWQKTTSTFYYAGAITALNGGLNGTYTETIANDGGQYKSTITIYGYGHVNNRYLIFKAKVKGLVKPG